jgi:hypothetical protein
MCEFLVKIEWLNLIQTIAVIFAAYIAYAALNTWKHQAKAQKQTDFLDQLTDAVHEYILSLSQPVELVKFIHIGFENYKNLPGNLDHQYSNIIAYITARGAEDSKKLWEPLNSNSHLVAKIQALIAKGQMYDFINFNKCQDSIKMLLWQHQRLQVVALLTGSMSLNWEHPVVIKGIENMLTVEPVDIENHLLKYNLEFLSFVQENYQFIYKGT